MTQYTCPCCGYLTLDSDGHYAICEICFWEDDPFQKMNPYSDGGANHISLAEAQLNYMTFGACDRESVDNVRKSNLKDRRDPDWKPVKEDELI